MVILVLFVLLNMHVLVNFDPDNTAEINQSLLSKLKRANNLEEFPHVQRNRNHVPIEGNASRLEVFIPVNQYNKTFSHRTIEEGNLTQIQLEIDRINSEQFIYNLNRFGLQLKSDGVVIVVQVHDRAQYLEILINSLRRVKQIQNSLIIFSHDVYNEELNRIVQSIDFSPVSILLLYVRYTLASYAQICIILISETVLPFALTISVAN